jgi:hypothetical protein
MFPNPYVGGDIALCGQRNVSRHVVDIRDLVNDWHWHSLIPYGVAFRDLENGWIGFGAIKLRDFGGPSARTWIAVYREQGDLQLGEFHVSTTVTIGRSFPSAPSGIVLVTRGPSA